MHNTCVSSRIGLRCNGSFSYSFNDYSYCSNDRFCRHPFAYSSQFFVPSSSSSFLTSCCACCANANSLLHRVPVAPTYLYGLRQSTLIQYTPCRRVTFNGLDWGFNRLTGCDVGKRCYYKKVCDYGEKGVSRRRGGRGNGRYGCKVFEESAEGGSFGCVDNEAEIVLSLLTEEVSEECFDVRKRNERGYNKVVVEERGNRGGGTSYRGKIKNEGSGVSESSSKFEYELAIKRDEDEKRKQKRREKGLEALSRKECKRESAREDKREELLGESHKQRVKKEERQGFLRESHTEREDALRESRHACARKEGSEDFLRREEQREKLRKDGSSCSSYYSVSSMGEFDSDNEIQVKHSKLDDNLSSKYKRDSRRQGEIAYEGEAEEGVERHEDYVVEQGLDLRKGKTAEGDEWNWRKQPEKKLTHTSSEVVRYGDELSQERSKLSEVYDSVSGKASYKRYDENEGKMTSAVKSDERSRQQHRQASDEAVQQSETRINYKQFIELSESHDTNLETSSSSQKLHNRRKYISSKDSISDQDTREEHYKKASFVTREEEYNRRFGKLVQSSNIENVDISKTSSSKVISETSQKNQEKHSSTVLSSVHDAKEKHHRGGQLSSQVDSRLTSQQLAKDVNIASSSMLLRKSEHRTRKEEERSQFTHGSYHESTEQHFQSNEEVGRLDSQVSMKKSADTSMVQYSGTRTNDAGEGSRRKSEAVLTPPSALLELRNASNIDSTSGLAVEEISQECSHRGAAASHRYSLDSPSTTQYETHSGGRRNETGGQPLGYISQEDALGSAVRLQKSSTYYVGEFVEKVRHEISGSESQREKHTYETKVEHDQQHEQKSLTGYVSGDSQLKEHDPRSRRSSPTSRTQGPSDEIWDVTLNQGQPGPKRLDDRISAGSLSTKRTGRSLWNIIADIVHLRWARSTNQSTAGKSVGRSSPNQSTSSETWFSGNERDENVHEGKKNRSRGSEHGSIDVDQQEVERARSQRQGESSTSSSSKDHMKLVGGDSLSYAEVVGQGIASGINFLLSGEETSHEGPEGTISDAAMAGSSLQLPSIRLRRSSRFIGEVSEAEEVDASASGKIVQTEVPVSTGASEMSQSEGKGELKRTKFQRTNQLLKDQFDEWEEAYIIEREQRKIDEIFMREALLEAKKAADSWEVPVGAVLVHNGKIIARGYNLVEELRDSTAHAEMICIREASNNLKTWRLSETTLYVTLEPCPMCAGAILQARIDTVVWGAPNKLLGADGSWIRLFPNGDGDNSLGPSDKPAAPVHPFHPKITIRRNVLASECADAMQQFFQRRRKKKEKKQDPPTPPSCLPIPHHPSKLFTKMHDAFHLMLCL